MRIPRSLKRIAVPLLIPLAFAAAAADESGLARYRPLIKRNPFLPKSDMARPASQPSTAAPYRFTGLMTVGKKTLIAVENPAENRSLLLVPGQNVDGVQVKEVNAKEKAIVLAANGETMRLEMVEAAALASPGPAVVATNPSSGPGAAAGLPTPATPAATSTGTVQQVRRRIIVPKRN